MRKSGCAFTTRCFFDLKGIFLMENTNIFLGNERIGKLMKQYAIPCIISLLVAALYNIVDQIFIANASYLGSYGNAANTVVYPLTVVALAAAVMIGDGFCAFVSISLGKGETASAKRSVGSSVFMTIAMSLIITAVYIIFSDSIIAMFGGTVNEETFRLSKEYFFYISLGIPFYIFGQEQYAQIPMAVVGIVMKSCFIFLQAMGKAAQSTALSMIREVIFGVGFALLLPLFFGLDGVLYSMPVSDIMTFIVALYLIIRTYKDLNKA